MNIVTFVKWSVCTAVKWVSQSYLDKSQHHVESAQVVALETNEVPSEALY